MFTLKWFQYLTLCILIFEMTVRCLMMDFCVCESLGATKLIQTNLPYLSAQALEYNLLVDVKDDYCTCPDNGLEILKCSYVTGESARDLSTLFSHADCLKTSSFPQQSSSCRFLSRQDSVIYTPVRNDFFKQWFTKACLYFQSSLYGCTAVTQIIRGRLSCTFLT